MSIRSRKFEKLGDKEKTLKILKRKLMKVDEIITKLVEEQLEIQQKKK